MGYSLKMLTQLLKISSEFETFDARYFYASGGDLLDADISWCCCCQEAWVINQYNEDYVICIHEMSPDTNMKYSEVMEDDNCYLIRQCRSVTLQCSK